MTNRTTGKATAETDKTKDKTEQQTHPKQIPKVGTSDLSLALAAHRLSTETCNLFQLVNLIHNHISDQTGSSNIFQTGKDALTAVESQIQTSEISHPVAHIGETQLKNIGVIEGSETRVHRTTHHHHPEFDVKKLHLTYEGMDAVTEEIIKIQKHILGFVSK